MSVVICALEMEPTRPRRPPPRRSAHTEIRVRVPAALYQRCLRARGDLTVSAWLLLVLRWWFALEARPAGPPPG